MAEQYRGQFMSNDGVLYTAIISNDNYTGESEDIPHFESEGEIEISWDEVEKYDVIQGSEAKVRIISETDRRFIDMYTETPGSIRLDVYKNETPDDVEGIGSLYWSGCLDCEFYEEPYSEEKNYAVELTFTDFGILDRLKFDINSTTPVTLAYIYAMALTKTCLNIDDINLDNSLISLNKTLNEIGIDTRNFYDEDGEAQTWKEALESIFQPLSIRMIQRNGTIYLYDLHALYNSESAQSIEWRGDNATLGVDKVFNNIKVTFSPYAENEIVSDDNDATKATDPTTYTFYEGYADGQTTEGSLGFYLYTDTVFAKGTVTEGLPVSMKKVYFGDDVDCVAGFYVTGDGSISTEGATTKHEYSSGTDAVPVLFKTEMGYIQPSNATNCALRLTLPMLLNVKYNPWADVPDDDDDDADSKDNENEHWNTVNAEGASNCIAQAVRIYLKDANGNILYHLNNTQKASKTDYEQSLDARGEWVTGDYNDMNYGDNFFSGADRCAMLLYYNKSGLTGNILGTWVTNTHGSSKDIASFTVSDAVKNAPEGQYIPLPPTSGFIEIQVLKSFVVVSQNNTITGWSDMTTGYYDWLRWYLFKWPALTLIEDVAPYSDVSVDDIETNGLIDPNAKEDLELDFNCGTPTGVVPNSLGTYCDPTTFEQLHTFTRAGRTDTAEQLFIGTCFSQYAKRNTTLNGDVKIDTGALKAYTDPYITKRYVDGVGTDTGESAKKFLMVSDVQKLSTDRSETKFVEFMKDIYTKK